MEEDGKLFENIARSSKTATTMQVEIPAGAAPGSVIRFAAPNGSMMEVVVPPGAAPGSTVFIQLPAAAPPPSADNTMIEVTVPTGAGPGTRLNFSTLDGRSIECVVPDNAPSGTTLKLSVPMAPAAAVPAFDPVVAPALEMRSSSSSSSSSSTTTTTTSVAQQQRQRRRRRRTTLKDVPENPKMRPDELNARDYSPDDFHCVRASLHSNLRFDDIVAVVHMTGDTLFSCELEHVAPLLFDLISPDGKDEFNLDELIHGVKSEAVRALVTKTKCRVLKQLISDRGSSAQKAFIKIDDNGDGKIEYSEWMLFLVEIRNTRLRYYRRIALLKGKLYNGYGLEPGETADTGWRCVVPRGFVEDFAHFSRNNHPLLMMFMASEDHYFGGWESTADFFCGFSITILGSSILALSDDSMPLATYIILSFIVVSAPTGIIKAISYSLFARPCLVIMSDESTAGRKKTFCLHCNACFCACCGYCFTFVTMVFCLTFGIIFWVQVGGNDGLWFLGSAMFQYWISWFVYTLALPFNPFFRPDRWNKCTSCLMCLPLFAGLGAWYKERAKVLDAIRSKIELRGQDRFFVPEAAVDEEEQRVSFSGTGTPFKDAAGMAKLFKILDADDSGGISKEEMLAGNMELGMTKEEASVLFDELDTDGNGVVTPEELAMMKKHKKHLVALEKEKGELQKHLDGRGLGSFAAKLHGYGIEQVADLNDPHLVDAHMLTDEIGMTDEQAVKCLAK